MSLNLGYLTTKPGLFKAISVVVGLVALVFSAIAYDKAVYNDKCTPAEKLHHHSEIGNLGYPETATCEQYHPNFYDHCVLELEKIEAYKNSQAGQMPSWAKKRVSQYQTSCPHPALVGLPVCMLGITWAASFVTLLLMLVVDLSQKSAFVKIDFVGHAIVAGAFLLSTLFLTGFIIWVFAEKYPCTQEGFNWDSRNTFGLRPSFSSITFDDSEDQDTLMVYRDHDEVDKRINIPYDSCAAQSNYIYQMWLLIGGAVFSAAGTVMYGITLVVLNRKGPAATIGGPSPTPMMSGGDDSAVIQQSTTPSVKSAAISDEVVN